MANKIPLNELPSSEGLAEEIIEFMKFKFPDWTGGTSEQRMNLQYEISEAILKDRERCIRCPMKEWESK